MPITLSPLSLEAEVLARASQRLREEEPLARRILRAPEPEVSLEDGLRLSRAVLEVLEMVRSARG